MSKAVVGRQEHRKQTGADGGAIDPERRSVLPSDKSLPRDVRSAVDFIRANPHRVVPIIELAAHAGVSSRRLHEHFQRFVGVSPGKYGQRLRLNAVQRDLRRPLIGEPIAEIAGRYGFAHPARFSQQYRRLFGETPSATRQASAVRAKIGASVVRSDRPKVLILPFDAAPALKDLADYLSQCVVNELDREIQIVRGATPLVPRRRHDVTARYLIEGRLVSAGDRLQIVLSLIYAETGAHLWGDAWSGWLPQPLPAIERAVTAAAGAIPSAIRGADSQRVRGMRPQDMDAYQLCLRAYPLLAANTTANAEHALDLLYRAIERDPDYGLATAFAGWAHAQLVLQMGSASPAADRAQALLLAARAGMLDQNDAMVLTARSVVHTAAGEGDRAADLVARALARNPRLGWAWERSGWLRAYAADMRGATTCFGRALRLDPVTPAKAILGISAGLFDSGRYELSVRWMRRALEAEPDAAWINRTLAVAYAQLGERSLAAQSMEALQRYRPGIRICDVEAAMHFPSDFVSRVTNGLDDLGLPP